MIEVKELTKVLKTWAEYCQFDTRLNRATTLPGCMFILILASRQQLMAARLLLLGMWPQAQTSNLGHQCSKLLLRRQRPRQDQQPLLLLQPAPAMQLTPIHQDSKVPLEYLSPRTTKPIIPTMPQ